MFITNSHRGYTRNGQRAEGRFLIVFSHNPFKWEEQNNVPHDTHGQMFTVYQLEGGDLVRQCECDPGSYYTLRQCPAHGQEYRKLPAELSRKLYAHVCYVKMKQLGHFMMGDARTLEVQGKPYKYLVLSGTYGEDGLTCDYEDLTEASRRKLVEVPPELTDQFWAGGGHNSAGPEGPAMREWAIRTFSKGGKR